MWIGLKLLYIGNFKNSICTGFGKEICELSAMDVEGFWENDKFIEDQTKIKSYDIQNDPIAKKIDVFKYLYPDLDTIKDDP